jgi:hypothetical protein
MRAAAADDRAPRRRPQRPQHAVLIEEVQERAGRERAAAIGRERPQRGGERDDEAVAELAADPPAREVVIERRRPDRTGRDVAARAAHERQDVGEEPPVARIEQPAAIGEHRGEPGAAPLEIIAGVARQRDRERHRRRPGRDPELAEHGEERRVALAVAHDEAEVDRMAIGVDRVDMAAGPLRGIVQRHRVAAGERTRCRQPCDPRSDDRDLRGHRRGSGGASVVISTSSGVISAGR